jgi:hypothetical protein
VYDKLAEEARQMGAAHGHKVSDRVRESFRVVGFVHHKVLIEPPDEGGSISEARARRVEEITCRAMESVMVGGTPVACESALSERWSKKAKLVVEGGRVLPWRPAIKG